jgi:hypothetical protein
MLCLEVLFVFKTILFHVAWKVVQNQRVHKISDDLYIISGRKL